MIKITFRNKGLVVFILFPFILLVSGISHSATVQNFDGVGSSYYTAGIASVQSGGPSGNFMRLVPAEPSKAGAIYFYTTDPDPAQIIIAEFDFRMFSGYRADGFSITFLNISKYPDNKAPAPYPFGEWEEPNFGESLGIGFDIFRNLKKGDPNDNHLSVHFNNNTVSTITFTNNYQLWKSDEPGFDHARIVANFVSGKVSIYITPYGGSEFTAVENLSVPGLTSYTARVAFGARTGGSYANHDIDNINVRFQPVPAPAALLLLASGLVGVFGIKRRMR